MCIVASAKYLGGASSADEPKDKRPTTKQVINTTVKNPSHLRTMLFLTTINYRYTRVNIDNDEYNFTS